MQHLDRLLNRGERNAVTPLPSNASVMSFLVTRGLPRQTTNRHTSKTFGLFPRLLGRVKGPHFLSGLEILYCYLRISFNQCKIYTVKMASQWTRPVIGRLRIHTLLQGGKLCTDSILSGKGYPVIPSGNRVARRLVTTHSQLWERDMVVNPVGSNTVNLIKSLECPIGIESRITFSWVPFAGASLGERNRSI